MVSPRKSKNASWTKTIRIFFGECGAEAQGLETIRNRSKRIVVENFPSEKMTEGMIPIGLMVKDQVVRMLNKTGRSGPALIVREPGKLFLVTKCRHWDREKRSFLVEFRIADEGEETVHKVMTE